MTEMPLITHVSVILVLHTNALLGETNLLLGEGNGTPLQYSCLENPRDGEVWWAAVHEVTKSQT